MPDRRLAPILIAGPTASGKSAFALWLAERIGGVVINADAMQVYRDLRILTARPSPDDEARVPHWLYGHVPATEAYSAGRYAADAGAALARAQGEGLRAIIVGGTGLYFKALLEGLSPVPPVAGPVRAHWRAEAARLGAGGLFAILAARDPAMAERLRPTDTQRLTRALEVLDGTGRSLLHWQRLPGAPVLAEPVEKLVLMTGRAAAEARSDRRFDRMLAAGALAEVQALRDAGLDPALPVMSALGVPPLLAHLRGDLSLAAAAAAARRDTRHYIKRQLTWMKRHMMSWTPILAEDMERNDRSINLFIDSFGPRA